METHKTEEKKIDSFQTKCLRRILKVRWQQHISNFTILEIAETLNISGEIREGDGIDRPHTKKRSSR